MADTFICIGVQADLSNLPDSMLFPAEHPFIIADKEYDFLHLHNYARLKGYAPKGSSAVTAFFVGDSYEYRKTKKQNGEYEAEKEKAAMAVIELLAKKLPQTAGKAAVADVAAPLT